VRHRAYPARKSRVAGRTAIRLSLVPVPALPSALDRWASGEILRLIEEAPHIVTRFVLNRCVARAVIARETAEALADCRPPALAAQIGQHAAFADAAQSGRRRSRLSHRLQCRPGALRGASGERAGTSGPRRAYVAMVGSEIA
jgi:chromosome partitioning protein